MKDKRPPLETDQENIEIGYQLILELMNKHQEIEPTLWAGSVWSTLVRGYINSGFYFEEFLMEINKVCETYKPWWESDHGLQLE